MRITSKGQVTIPLTIRRRCGLLPHSDVEFRVEEGSVILQKVSQAPSRGEEALQRLRQGLLSTTLSTEELLALTRGEDVQQEIAFATDRIEVVDELLPSHLYAYRPAQGSGLPGGPRPCRLQERRLIRP
jgi:AbrB family looped-hinge helix DNA binding protein